MPSTPTARRWPGRREDGTHDALFERPGHGYPPGLSAPILRWFADAEPAVFDRAETLLFCKDWVRYRLTGTVATDPTEASLVHHDLGGEGDRDDVPELVGVPELTDLGTAVARTVTTERDHEPRPGASAVPSRSRAPTSDRSSRNL